MKIPGRAMKELAVNRRRPFWPTGVKSRYLREVVGGEGAEEIPKRGRRGVKGR
jgi:hypothetical protein